MIRSQYLAMRTSLLVALAFGLLTGCDSGTETSGQSATQTPETTTEEMAPAQEAKEEMDDQTQTPAQTETADMDPQAMLKSSGCLACHDTYQKKIGPAYAWVAYRYQDNDNAVQILSQSIKDGSSGKWQALTGGAPMPPNPALSDDKREALAKWILDRTPEQPPES